MKDNLVIQFEETKAKVNEEGGIVAILYRTKEDELSFSPFRFGDKEGIESKIGRSDGRAISIKMAGQSYWLLIGEEGFFLFQNEDAGPERVKSEDTKVGEYLATMM